MSLEYTIQEVKLTGSGKEKRRKVIRFNNPDLRLLEEFLMVDAPLHDWSILRRFEEVNRQGTSLGPFVGNRTSTMIGPVQTKIEDSFDFPGMDPLPSVKLPTDMLYELILTWRRSLEN